MGSGAGTAMGPHSGDDRDLRQGSGERVRWRPAEAVPEAHLDLEPVRARRYGVAEVLAGAGGSVNDRDGAYHLQREHQRNHPEASHTLAA